MKCPVCKKEMVILEMDQVEIDYCPPCDGIWLDDGELELLLEDGEAKQKVLATFHHEPDHPEKTRRCPRCNKRMQKVFVGDHKDVLLDRCRKGHGLWFDSGELREVVKLGSIDPQNKIIGLLNEMFAEKIGKSLQK